MTTTDDDTEQYQLVDQDAWLRLPLFEKLENTRQNNPVFWCIITGTTTVGEIALRLNWSVKRTMKHIEYLLPTGWIFQIRPHQYMLNKREDEVEEKFMPLAEYAAKVRANAKVTADRSYTETWPITTKQRELLDIVEKTIKQNSGDPATAKQIAAAQGYPVVGFTVNVLKVLEKKGYLKTVEGRPRRWELV